MFDFIMQQILGMQWLSELIWRMLAAMGADQASPVWGSVHFFIYDALKISILLVSLIFFYILYSVLFSTGKNQAYTDGLYRGEGGGNCRASGDGYALLLMLKYSHFYRFYKSGTAAGNDVCFFDFLTDGGHCFHADADVVFWQ